MRIRDIVMCLTGLVWFSGCGYFIPSYEILVKRVLDPTIGKSYIPQNFGINSREIYDENRYVYISEYPKGCIVGYLTNRDDKLEVVQEWIILSGKENCKETSSFVLLQ